MLAEYRQRCAFVTTPGKLPDSRTLKNKIRAPPSASASIERLESLEIVASPQKQIFGDVIRRHPPDRIADSETAENMRFEQFRESPPGKPAAVVKMHTAAVSRARWSTASATSGARSRRYSSSPSGSESASCCRY